MAGGEIDEEDQSKDGKGGDYGGRVPRRGGEVEAWDVCDVTYFLSLNGWRPHQLATAGRR
jgi:hypothetical protein